MLYLDFFAVLNSLIYLLSIRVVNFSQKCHFDALKLIMSNQPTRDCDSLFESVLKNVDFPSLATDIASTRTLTCCIPLCASLPPLSPCGFFFVDFRITSAQQRHFHPREIHDNLLIRRYDLRFSNSEALISQSWSRGTAGFPQWRLFMFCENHATFTKMVRTKQPTVRSAPKTKNKRKQQLKNINRGMKRVTTASTPSQVTESSRVPVDVNHVLPVSVPSTASSDNTLLGERTRTQFKRDSYENVLSSEAGRRSMSSTSADGSASGDRDTRRGVVDFKEVGHLIDCLCCPVCRSNTLSLKTDTRKPQGLAVHAQVYCSSCEQVVSERYLASKRDLKSKIFDINRQAVYSSLVCGLGSSTFNNFCESMDLPGLHHKTFHSHAKAMYSKLELLEDRAFGQTVAYVREVHAKHSGTTLAEDDVLNISVSFDGTWLTRGHSSHVGVGCVVDLLTGLCIDAHVMCTYCQVCETTGQKLQRDKPEEYAPWLVKHADECDKNFTGNLLLLFYILFVTPSFSFEYICIHTQYWQVVLMEYCGLAVTQIICCFDSQLIIFVWNQSNNCYV